MQKKSKPGKPASDSNVTSLSEKRKQAGKRKDVLQGAVESGLLKKHGEDLADTLAQHQLVLEKLVEEFDELKKRVGTLEANFMTLLRGLQKRG